MKSDLRRSVRSTACVSIAVAVAIVVSASCTAKGADTTYGAAPFVTSGGVNQVSVVDATPNTALQLRNETGHVVASATADSDGSAVFWNVSSGPGYRVTATAGSPVESSPVTVLTDRPAPLSTKIYDQTIPTGWDAKGAKTAAGGYGYVTVRDGTKLAINVHPAGPEDKGPYPTVIEYGGYAFAKPGGGESSIAPVWNALGFTVVDVNMRGTGCSGGAFQYFAANELLDGYDVIETVARQPWVLNHKVGMIGISFGGFSQLFVAQTNPPHLAAITPDSALAGVTTTLYPGGMLNTGFALKWAQDRDADAKPASAHTGQAWAWKQIESGDTTCKANQKLHSQAPSLVSQIHHENTYIPSVVDPLTLSNVVPKIKAPTFLSCQFTDEQTGGYCPFLADHFTSSRSFKAAFTNGAHIDALDPVQLQHQFDLLELEVADRKPDQTALKAFAPVVYGAEMKAPGVTVPDDPIADAPTKSEAASRYAALPTVEVLYDTGHGSATPGAPVAGFTHGFSGLDDPSIHATPYFFGADGSLTTTEPTVASSASFLWDPDARPRNSMASEDVGNVWMTLPKYEWKPLVPGRAVSFVSAPLTHDVVTFGGGSVDVWIKSSAPDTDLQATISEVRPDGQELFVQNGWLRASYRKLDPKRSTPLQPVPWARKSDISPLPEGTWTLVHIPLYAQGHAFRTGSRIRVTIEAPGGDQPSWAFEALKPAGPVTDSIAIAPDMASQLLLPVVTGMAVPTPLPAVCEGMRGEPCRAYEPFSNSVGPNP
ncbi:MAG: CocE/NonD family hydrolase [Actinobacteria bacterium]|nr:CocE/NonD family hydrolase [Actinomycetota bacterium]